MQKELLTDLIRKKTEHRTGLLGNRLLGNRSVVLEPTHPTSRKAVTFLRLLELCYRYAYLHGRRSAGLRLRPEEVDHLGILARRLEGDPAGRRRKHRRFPVELPAAIKTARGLASCVVLDLSGAGMRAASTRGAAIGDTVQIKVGMADAVEYLFTCTVCHLEEHDERFVLGLRYSCVPLEMRR